MLLMGAAQPAAAADGGAVFTEWCAGCHADSPLAPGTVLLRAVRGDEFAVIERRRDLTPELIRHVVRRGKFGMPSFRRTEIGNDELEALVRYLTSSPGQAAP